MKTLALLYVTIVAFLHFTKAIPDDGEPMTRQHWIQAALAMNLVIFIAIALI